jgi:predicted ATPase/DNA-binding SARP family transcriptional activator
MPQRGKNEFLRAELRVLGPVELVGPQGVVTTMPGKKHRNLLCVMALAGGRACSVDELVEALWGLSPPESARKLVQTYVSQLRKVLPAGIGIVTRGGSYALALEDAYLDADEFERFLGEARGALDASNSALAVSLAEKALRLWRGQPYGDVAYEEFAHTEIERLKDLRVLALELRFDGLVRLGGHDEALGEILALADEHPFRERLQELAMLALYRAGRQADALERFARLRRHLDDELGLEPGADLRRLQRQILEQDPDLEIMTERAVLGMLPEPPNALVGREGELEALEGLLRNRAARLLVLTGAGGSGKTRLALEAARRVASSYANGALMVELAPLEEAELVLPTIVHAVGASHTREPLEALAEALGPREMLLVIDNVEHVSAAAASFVDLLSRAAHLTLLVTSRSVLHLTGERVVPVPPLELEASEQLFEERARALRADFRISPTNREIVREICRRVDGLPLAIELAAARTRALPAEAVLARLTERLSFLAGGPRDLPARQQTLHETLDWSYDLLSEDERTLLTRLAVFRGGGTLPAIADICLDGDDHAALDLIEGLLDASLVVAYQVDSEARYGLLETVRQYASERLNYLTPDNTEQRHAEWYLDLAERAEAGLSTERQTELLQILETEHDNARAALAFLVTHGETALALRLTVALSRFWYVRGHLGEARRHLQTVVPTAMRADPLLRRRAETAGASIALLQGDYQTATMYAEQALQSAHQAGEPRFVANALSNLGAIVLAAGDDARATIVLEEAVTRAREVGDDRINALALNNLGDLALATENYDRAKPLFEESLNLLRALGDTSNISRSLFNLGAATMMLGDMSTAAARFHESLELALQANDQEDIAWCFEGFAALAARQDDGRRAALLTGAAGALLRAIGAEYKPFERRMHQETESRARSLLGAEEFSEQDSRGAALPRPSVLQLVHDQDL